MSPRGRVLGRGRGVGGGRRGVKFVCVAEIRGDQGSGWGWVQVKRRHRAAGRRVRLVDWPIRRLLHLSGAHFSGRARASWWGCASSGGCRPMPLASLRSIGSAQQRRDKLPTVSSMLPRSHAPTLPRSPHSTRSQQPQACRVRQDKKRTRHGKASNGLKDKNKLPFPSNTPSEHQQPRRAEKRKQLTRLTKQAKTTEAKPLLKRLPPALDNTTFQAYLHSITPSPPSPTPNPITKTQRKQTRPRPAPAQ